MSSAVTQSSGVSHVTMVLVSPSPSATAHVIATDSRRSIATRSSATSDPFVLSTAPAQNQMPVITSTERSVRVPILMYHYISVPPWSADRFRLDLSVTPTNLDEQLTYLASNGYETISLDDLYDHLSAGKHLPPKPIILTFDDGYRDAYEFAYPLLRKHNMTGTFFIISDFASSGNPAYMSWDMIKEMSQTGMSIESHTRTHPDLRNQTNDYLVWQIMGPIEAITDNTGKRPRFFCYPSGQYDAAVIHILRSVGTLAAVTTQYGTTHSLADAMTWSRVRIHGSTTLTEFANLMALTDTGISHHLTAGG